MKRKMKTVSPHRLAKPTRSAVGDIHDGLNERSATNLEKMLKEEMSQGYRPTLPVYSLRSPEILGYQFFQDVEMMRMHPAVKMPLEWALAPLQFAEWTIQASDPECAEYASKLLLWWWANAMWPIQYEGSCYGWSACEVQYHDRDGYIYPKQIDMFSSRDVYPVIFGPRSTPTGIQILYGNSKESRLWGFRDSIPNKAFWYAHRARHNMRYGESQVRPAWKPWRRLAGVDGLEEINDLAIYRFGTGFVKVFHPNENNVSVEGSNPRFATNGTTTSSRDVARQMSENLKSGAGIALSSERWPQVAGGGLKWDVVVDTFNVDLNIMLAQSNYLERLCAAAIGVPPEVIQAAETGSGYSGRAIPLQGFLSSQQYTLNDVTRQVTAQIIQPLIKWCCGWDKWVDITPKPLIKSYRMAAWDDNQGGGGDGGNGQTQQSAVASSGQPPFANGSNGPAQA